MILRRAKESGRPRSIKYVVDDEVIIFRPTANFFTTSWRRSSTGSRPPSRARSRPLNGQGARDLSRNSTTSPTSGHDGADEVTEHGAMIKGGGGADARKDRRRGRSFVCIADGSKLVGFSKFSAAGRGILGGAGVAWQLVLPGQPAWRMRFPPTTVMSFSMCTICRSCDPLRWKEDLFHRRRRHRHSLRRARRGWILLGTDAGVKTVRRNGATLHLVTGDAASATAASPPALQLPDNLAVPALHVYGCRRVHARRRRWRTWRRARTRARIRGPRMQRPPRSHRICGATPRSSCPPMRRMSPPPAAGHDAFVDRLTLGATASTRWRSDSQIAALLDPVGEITELVSSLRIQVGLMRVPLGVVDVHESRPNVTADAAGLCPRCGNDDPARRIRGNPQQPRHRGLHHEAPPPWAYRKPPAATTDRAAVGCLIADDEHVDCDRATRRQGSDRRITHEAKVPVIKHPTASATCSSTRPPTRQWRYGSPRREDAAFLTVQYDGDVARARRHRRARAAAAGDIYARKGRAARLPARGRSCRR